MEFLVAHCSIERFHKVSFDINFNNYVNSERVNPTLQPYCTESLDRATIRAYTAPPTAVSTPRCHTSSSTPVILVGSFHC
jgi:hypothetical protein